jgi:hypothetical protein
MIKTVEVTSFAFRSTGNNSRFGAPRWNSLVDLTRNETRQGRWHAWAAYEKVVRAKRKRPLSVQRPFVTQIFRSYDNPHTICQNLPEAAEASAEAEEGQRE